MFCETGLSLGTCLYINQIVKVYINYIYKLMGWWDTPSMLLTPWRSLFSRKNKLRGDKCPHSLIGRAKFWAQLILPQNFMLLNFYHIVIVSKNLHTIIKGLHIGLVSNAANNVCECVCVHVLLNPSTFFTLWIEGFKEKMKINEKWR